MDVLRVLVQLVRCIHACEGDNVLDLRLVSAEGALGAL